MTIDVMENGVIRPATPKEEAEIVARRLNAPPKLVPHSVTMLQARLALLNAGKLASINTHIAQMTGLEGEAARTYWEFAQHVVRSDPLVVQLSTLLALDESALDQLFIVASAL